MLPVYIIEPEVIHASDFDALHWDFIRESLLDVQSALRERGAVLQVIIGDAVTVLNALHEQYQFTTLWAHEETGNAITYRRDQSVTAWTKESGVSFKELPQNGVIRGLEDRDGWAKQWERRMSSPIFEAPSRIQSLAGLPDHTIPASKELGLSVASRMRDLRGGESAGLHLLESFVSQRGHSYHREMSSPNTAYESCSRLSPYLSWGCLSMRTIVQAVRELQASKCLKLQRVLFSLVVTGTVILCRNWKANRLSSFMLLTVLAIIFVRQLLMPLGLLPGKKGEQGIHSSMPACVRS